MKKFTKKLAHYFGISAIVFGSTFGSFNAANAAAVNQGTSAKNTYANADNITFTGATASTVLAAADQLTNMINTDGTDVTYSLSGAFKLDLTGSTFSLKATDGETMTVNLGTSGGSLDLGEATIGSVIINAVDGAFIDVTAADTHTLTFDGSTADAGILEVSGTTTFSGKIGETNGIASINVDDSKVGTFSETVQAETITLTGEGIFNKAVTATTISLVAGEATFKNTDAVTIAGAITEASGATTLAVLNSADAEAPSVATISGAVTVDTITIGATATAGSVKFSSTVEGTSTIHGGNAAVEDSLMEITDTHTGAVVLTQAGSGDAGFKTSGSTALSVTGAITATTDGDGVITSANTNQATFAAVGTDAKKILSVTVSSGADAVFGAAVAANTLTITGEATLQAADNESETIAMGASSALIIDDTLTNGVNVFNEVATTRPTLTSGAKIYMPGNLKTGQTLILFLGEANNGLADNATTVTETNTALQDNALFDYTAAANSADNGSTVVTATVKDAQTTESELGVTNNKAVALKQALLAAIDDTNADSTAEDSFTNALNGINGLSSTADTELANQVGTQTDGIAGSISATRVMTGTVQGIVSSRMAYLRSGDAYITGVAAGDGINKKSGFLQIFGSDVTQENTTEGNGTQFGYTSETVGYALGFDSITDDGSVIGFSLSSSETDVTGKGRGNSTNDIESYTASIYADKVTDNGYLEGSITFGINENATTRKITTAGLNRNYKGSYDSEQISIKIGGGVPSQMGNGAFITTFGSITGTEIKTDSYTETSNTANDNLRLKVDQDDILSVVGSVGFKIHKVSDMGTPFFSFAINQEFGDDTINNTNTYQGGGSAFKTSTKVEELSATLGLGFSSGSDTTSINFGYEAEANENDYLSHYGSLKVVHKF